MNNAKLISLVLPTLGTRVVEITRLFESLKNQNYTNYEVILVSQDNHQKMEELLNNVDFTYKHVKLYEKGLSLARNEGLKHVSGEIVTFSDDDCWYLPNSFENIISQFEQKDSAIICFQHYDPIKKRHSKQYDPMPIDKITWKKVFNKASIEIFVNLKVLNKEEIHFDTRFGLGAKYPSGEENIFLIDTMKKGYKISYVPMVIAYHEIKGVSNTLNYRAFLSKGPMFKRMFNTQMGIFLLLALYMKKFSRLENKAMLLKDSIKETITFKK